MEDDLKTSKFEYISNHLLDLPQILNLSSGDQTKIKMHDMNRTYVRMEEDLKILIVECLSNQWAGLPKILNLG